MRVALVHDWLTGMRGGERVLDEIAGLFPGADLYTLIFVPGATSERIEGLRIHASPLSRLPGAGRHYRKLLPLFPWAIERFEPGDCDLVLSTSHAVAKGIRAAPGVPHLCYCFTPMRYVWDQVDTYLGRGVFRALAAPLVAYLRNFDLRTSRPERVQRFVACSHAVAARIRQCYGREAAVVHPPVAVERIRPSGRPPEDFFLLVAGFVPYKREDLAIEAFRRLGLRLRVVGRGPGFERLAASAPRNVEFAGRVSDAELADHYARCRALVFPGDEDFGLVPVEAQAAGRPVIAYARGGALESVRGLAPGDASPAAGATGLFFEDPTPDSLVDAVRRFERIEAGFDPRAIRAHAERFAPARFREGLLGEISALLGSRGGQAAGE